MNQSGLNQALPAVAAPVGTAARVIYSHSLDESSALPREVSMDFINIDQAGTVRAYARPTSADAWREVDFAVSGGAAVFPLAVAASSAGVDNCVRVDISSYPCVEFRFTPAVALGTWQYASVRHW